jgi:hypothetical protein
VSIYNAKKNFPGALPPDPREQRKDREEGRGKEGRGEGKGREGKGREGKGREQNKGKETQFFALGRKSKSRRLW